MLSSAHNVTSGLGSDISGEACVRCGFQLARVAGSLPPTPPLSLLSKDRDWSLHEKARGWWVAGPECKNSTNCTWLLFMKLEVVSLSATPTFYTPKVTQRRQLLTVNTNPAGFVTTAIKGTNAAGKHVWCCTFVCVCFMCVRETKIMHQQCCNCLRLWEYLCKKRLQTTVQVDERTWLTCSALTHDVCVFHNNSGSQIATPCSYTVTHLNPRYTGSFPA